MSITVTFTLPDDLPALQALISTYAVPTEKAPVGRKARTKKIEPETTPEAEPVTREALTKIVMALVDEHREAEVRAALAQVGAARLRDVSDADLPRLAQALPA